MPLKTYNIRSSTDPESPAPVLNCELLTGHSMTGPGYRCRRTRGTDDWLLVLTLNGKGRFGSVTGLEVTAEAGDLTLIRPGTRHDYGTAQNVEVWELLWAHFYPRSGWHGLLHWPEVSHGLMRLSPSDPEAQARIEERFFDVYRLASGGLPGKDLFAMNALEEVLLWGAAQVPDRILPSVDPRVRLVLDAIQSRLNEKLSLADLASACGLSASRVSALFREQLGMTPTQYLEIQRISRAKQLLARTTMPIYSIASETGFENPFYFTLRFKRHERMSPLAWRRAQPGQP